MFAVERLDTLPGQLCPESAGRLARGVADRVSGICAARWGEGIRGLNIVLFTGLGADRGRWSAEQHQENIQLVSGFHRAVEECLVKISPAGRPTQSMVVLTDEGVLTWRDDHWVSTRAAQQEFVCHKNATSARPRVLCGDIVQTPYGARIDPSNPRWVLAHPDQYSAIMRAAETFYRDPSHCRF